MSEPPLQEADFNSWLELSNAIAFLRKNEKENEFVVYASDGYTFIHALLAPTQALNPPDIDDLMSWHCNPTSTWGINIQFSEPRSVWC